MMAAGGHESTEQLGREAADSTLVGLAGPATTAAAAHHAPANAKRAKPHLEQIMTKSYIIAKMILHP